MANLNETQYTDLLNDPQKLEELPISTSFEIVKTLSSAIYSNSNPKVNKLFIEASKVTNQFKKHSIIFDQKTTLLLQENVGFLKKEDIDLIKKEVLNQNQVFKNLEISDTRLWNFVEKIREIETENYIASLPDFEVEIDLCDKNLKISSSILNFLNKKILDQISSRIFGKVNAEFNSLLFISKNTEKDDLGKELLLKKKEISFSYINMRKMEPPKISRFAKLFDSYDVKSYSIKDYSHKNIKVKSQIIILNKLITVKSQAYCGQILCEDFHE